MLQNGVQEFRSRIGKGPKLFFVLFFLECFIAVRIFFSDASWGGENLISCDGGEHFRGQMEPHDCMQLYVQLVQLVQFVQSVFSLLALGRKSKGARYWSCLLCVWPCFILLHIYGFFWQE